MSPLAMAFLAKSNAARLSVVSNLGLTVVKLGIGLQIHSVAVLSEAIHSGIDLLAALIAWYAVRVADIPPDKGHPYGHGKVESISGTVEALLIFLAGAWVIYEAVLGIVNGRRSESVHLGLVVMAISAVVNVFVSRHLHKVAREHRSVALEADAHHLQVDVYTSIGVFIGLGLVALTGWHVFDQIVAIAVGLLILHTSFSITKAAFAPLLDATLPAEDVQLIEETLCSNPRVRGFHHLRTRKAGSVRFVDFHLLLEDDMTLKESHRISHEVKDSILAVLPGAVVEIHVEPYEEELSKKGQAIILPHMEEDVLGEERGL